MTSEQYRDPEACEQIEASMRGELRGKQLVAFEQRLLADDTWAALYLDYYELEVDLHLLAGEVRGLAACKSMLTNPLASAEPAPADDLPTLWSRSRLACYDFITNYITLSLLVSGLAMTIMVLSMALIVPDWNPIQPGPEMPAIEFVAHITWFERTNWDDESDGNLKNRDLFVGDKLILKEGIVEVTYDTGAQVVLEGPSTYMIEYANGGYLQVGKLMANVPVPAMGFTVDTPLGSVIDLGTEFGVESAGQTGPSSVHVISGKVEVSPNNSDGTRGKALRLTAGQAVRIGGVGSPRLSELNYDESQFAALREISARHSEPERLPGMEHLALWLTANEGVEYDADRRVRSWRSKYPTDNETLVAQAVNRGPLFTPALFRGRTSLAFSGDKSRLLLPDVELGDRVTLATVCWPQAQGPHGRRMALHVSGPGVFGLEQEKQETVRGRYFADVPPATSRQDVGIVATRWTESGPLFAVYTYDHTVNRAALYVNGALCGEANAPAKSAGDYQVMIGGHPELTFPFVGKVAEVLVYRQALSEQEIEELSAVMARKYGIISDE